MSPWMRDISESTRHLARTWFDVLGYCFHTFLKHIFASKNNTSLNTLPLQFFDYHDSTQSIQHTNKTANCHMSLFASLENDLKCSPLYFEFRIFILLYLLPKKSRLSSWLLLSSQLARFREEAFIIFNIFNLWTLFTYLLSGRIINYSPAFALLTIIISLTCVWGATSNIHCIIKYKFILTVTHISNYLFRPTTFLLNDINLARQYDIKLDIKKNKEKTMKFKSKIDVEKLNWP